MIILLHSSKTMRISLGDVHDADVPLFMSEAQQLVSYIQTLSVQELSSVMKISSELARKTKHIYDEWSTKQTTQIPAIDCFLGDIYSGFQVSSLSHKDRAYAHQHLRIISGLYGLLRALDGITPYRLEMAYRLPDPKYKNLYDFWGEKLASTVADEDLIYNLSSVEYSSAILPYLTKTMVVTPRFMTVDQKTGQPKFVVVHAKIARGAMAGWIIKNRVEDAADLLHFNELGYRYEPKLSTPDSPVFVAQQFGGIGLSVRLS